MDTRAKLLLALIVVVSAVFKPVLATTISLDITNDYHIPIAVIYLSNNTPEYVVIPAQQSTTIETTSTYVLIGTPLFRHFADYYGYSFDDFLIVGVSQNIGLLPTNSNGHFSLTIAPNNGQWFEFLQKGELNTGETFQVFLQWSDYSSPNFLNATITLPPFPVFKVGYKSIGDDGGITEPFMDLFVSENGSKVRLLNPAVISSANKKTSRISVSVGDINIDNHSIGVFLTKGALLLSPASTPVLSVFIDNKLATQIGTSMLTMVDPRDPASVFVASTFVSINDNQYVVLAYLNGTTEFNYSKAKLIMINLENFSDVKILTPSSGELYGLDKLEYIPVIDDRLDPIPLWFINQATSTDPYGNTKYENALYLRYFIIHASTETEIPLKNVYLTSFIDSGVFGKTADVISARSFNGLWNINPLLFVSYIDQKAIYVVNDNKTYIYDPNYALVYDVKSHSFYTFAQLVDNYTNTTFVTVEWPSTVSSELTVNYSKVLVSDYLTFNPSKDFHKPGEPSSISSGGSANILIPSNPTSASNTTTENTSSLTPLGGGLLEAIRVNNTMICFYNPNDGSLVRCSPIPSELASRKLDLTTSLGITSTTSTNITLEGGTDDTTVLLNLIKAVDNATWPSLEAKINVGTVFYPALEFSVNANVSTPFERYVLLPYYQYFNESMKLGEAFQFWVFVNYDPNNVPVSIAVSSGGMTFKLEHFITYTENGVTFSVFLLNPDDLQSYLLMLFKYLTDANAREPLLHVQLASGKTVTYNLTELAKEHEIPASVLKIQFTNRTYSYYDAFPEIELGNYFLPTLRFFVMDYSNNYLMRLKLSADYLIEFAFIFSQNTFDDFNNFLRANAELLYLKEPYIGEKNPPYETIALKKYVFYSTSSLANSTILTPSSTDYAVEKYSTFVVLFYTHVIAPAVQNPLANSVFNLKLSFIPAGLPATDTISYNELISHLSIAKLYDSASGYIVVPPSDKASSETIVLNLSKFSDLFTKDYYKRIVVQFAFNLTSTDSPDFKLFKSYNRNVMVFKTTKATWDSFINAVASSPNSLILFILLILFVSLYVAFDIYVANVVTLGLAILLKGAFTSLPSFITTLVALFIIGNLSTRGVAFLRKNSENGDSGGENQ